MSIRNVTGRGEQAANWRTLGARLQAPARRRIRPPFGRIATPAAVAFGIVLIFALMWIADPVALRILPDWPRKAVHIAAIVTNLGDAAFYLVPIGVALAGLVLVDMHLPARLDTALRQVWLRLAFAFTILAATGLSVNIIKRMIGRVRPLHVDPGAYLSFEPFSWHANNASFPSGHATTAWTMAAVVVLMFGPRLRPYAFAVASLVCLSRVVLGAHFVADVVAGALYGWFATFWFAQFLASRGLVFRQNGDGALALRGQGAAKTLFMAWRARRENA